MTRGGEPSLALNVGLVVNKGMKFSLSQISIIMDEKEVKKAWKIVKNKRDAINSQVKIIHKLAKKASDDPIMAQRLLNAVDNLEILWTQFKESSEAFLKATRHLGYYEKLDDLKIKLCSDVLEVYKIYSQRISNIY